MEDSDWLGGSIYIDNLLAALSVLPASTRCTVRLEFLSSPFTPLARRLLNHSAVRQKESRYHFAANMSAYTRRIKRALMRRWPWLGQLYSSLRRDELFFPSFDARQSWRKNLYWVPDFQIHYLPELFSPVELLSRKKSIDEISGSQGIMLLSSNTALEDFRKFYPNALVEPRVWSFCSSLEAGSIESCQEVIARYGLPDKYLYIANQFWRHKDHATVFNALRILHDRGMKIPLVCTGLQADRRDPDYFGNLINDLIRHGLQSQVRFLGVVPREDQIQVFRAAAAIVQPSRFEGWSTVIEDAKALGRPIIASDIDVHKEQLSGVDVSHLFEVSNATDLAECIAVLWETLPSGPDTDKELSAAERRNKIRMDAANQFVSIVDEAILYATNTAPITFGKR